ncbi:hypothetical protein Tco_1343341 [Tanacetum coccineum]
MAVAERSMIEPCDERGELVSWQSRIAKVGWPCLQQRQSDVDAIEMVWFELNKVHTVDKASEYFDEWLSKRKVEDLMLVDRPRDGEAHPHRQKNGRDWLGIFLRSMSIKSPTH